MKVEDTELKKENARLKRQLSILTKKAEHAKILKQACEILIPLVDDYERTYNFDIEHIANCLHRKTSTFMMEREVRLYKYATKDKIKVKEMCKKIGFK